MIVNETIYYAIKKLLFFFVSRGDKNMVIMTSFSRYKLIIGINLCLCCTL